MSEVLVFTDGRVGRIRLNRPKQLHALTAAMCAEVLTALDAWDRDDRVEAVLIDHAEGRGFCAGGDIRLLADSAAANGSAARSFFATEYRMNHRLFTWPKPIVSFMDGITMGGGVGISQPARFRVATEATRFAMPETGIGLFPDVGGGWYLSRLPGRVGQYLALTGARIDGRDCVELGLADALVHSSRLDELKLRVAAEPNRIGEFLIAASESTTDAPIMRQLDFINALFRGDRLEDILSGLEHQASEGHTWARDTLATLATKSPQTMKVSLRLLAEGAKTTDFADEMAREYAVASRVVMRPDFIEGVRAVIVDKDNAPRWSPATVAEVSDDLVDAIFAPLPPEEAWTPT